MYKFFMCLGLLALLGCSNLSDPTTAIVSAETAYAAAVSAEIVYVSSGKADLAVVRQIENYRVAAHNILEPMAIEAGSGNPPSSDAIAAAQTAVNVLTGYMTSKGIGVK
jgi:hypothetical protein